MTKSSKDRREKRLSWAPPTHLTRNQLRFQVVALIGFVILLFAGTSWLLSDISGEYTAECPPPMGTVRMSIVNKDGRSKSDLACGGYGTVLVANEPMVSAGQSVNWLYQVPDEWLRQGRKNRRVKFFGKIENGTIAGIIQDGAKGYPVKLERNPAVSVYRLILSYIYGGS